MLVSLAASLTLVASGVSLGFPAISLQQLTAEGLSEEDASWFGKKKVIDNNCSYIRTSFFRASKVPFSLMSNEFDPYVPEFRTNMNTVWFQQQAARSRSRRNEIRLYVAVRRLCQTDFMPVIAKMSRPTISPNSKITVLWNVTPCSFVCGYQCFRGTCCPIFRAENCWYIRTKLSITVFFILTTLGNTDVTVKRSEQITDNSTTGNCGNLINLYLNIAHILTPSFARSK